MGSLSFLYLCRRMEKLRLKRRIASWVLLSVFVPMMVLVSLHHHGFHTDVEHTCVQCEHHVPHAGHISAQTVSHGDCVVCQFTTLSYLPSLSVAYSPNLCPITADVVWQTFLFVAVHVGSHSSRAPPIAS